MIWEGGEERCSKQKAGCEDRLVPVVYERARNREGLGLGKIATEHL